MITPECLATIVDEKGIVYAVYKTGLVEITVYRENSPVYRAFYPDVGEVSLKYLDRRVVMLFRDRPENTEKIIYLGEFEDIPVEPSDLGVMFIKAYSMLEQVYFELFNLQDCMYNTVVLDIAERFMHDMINNEVV